MLFDSIFFCRKKQEKSIVKFNKKYFKKEDCKMDKKIHKYETRENVKKLKELRQLIMKTDAEKSLVLAKRHFRMFNNIDILSDIEKRVELFIFNPIDRDKISEIKKCAYSNTTINNLTLMYGDIGVAIAKKIRKNVYLFNPNYGDYAYFKWSKYNKIWKLDRRMMNISIKIYDSIWPKYIDTFNRLYYKVFDDDRPFDDYGNFYLEDDDYEGVKECRKMFINLMRCSTVFSINTMIRRHAFRNNFVPDYKVEDDKEQKEYYTSCIKNANGDFQDKFKCLFQNHVLSNRDIEKLTDFFRSY